MQSPYTFDFLSQFHNCPPEVRLYRTPQGEENYTKFRQDNPDVSDYIKQKYFTSTCDLLKIDDNNFPYNVAPDITHLVCWVNPAMIKNIDSAFLYNYVCNLLDTAADVTDLKSSSVLSKYIIWQNTPLNQSIKGVPHYHIFVNACEVPTYKKIRVKNLATGKTGKTGKPDKAV